jgi:hypothetical protein
MMGVARSDGQISSGLFTPSVEQDEAPDPIHISLFRAQAIMAITQLFPHLIEQARLCRPAVWGDIGRLWCTYHEGCLDSQRVILYRPGLYTI